MEPTKAAQAVMEEHFRALNARDEAALAATLHFPHYRLTDGTVKVWETPETYFTDFRKRAGGGWSHSALGPVIPVQTSADKVHLDVTVERYDTNGALLVTFQSLWVIALVKGRWAAQMRSSFAPDARIKAGG